MTKFDRIEAAINGEEVDRVPFSLWYHFSDIPVSQRAGETLAKAELEFYRTYDPDVLKVMHDIPYELPNGMATVDTLAQWKDLPVLDPEIGNFGQQLRAIQIILEEIGGEAPVIDTVFNPFAYAEKITGGKTLQFLRENADDFHEGMGQVTESLALWTELLVEQGAAGIYLAVQGAVEDLMTEEEYRLNFLPYDLEIMERVQDTAEMNVVHLHGEKLHWNIWEDLPFHALSWSSNITPPSIADARKEYDGCILCGVNETTINSYGPEQVIAEIRAAIAATEGLGYIAAPGCAVPTDCPPANLHAFKQAVMMGA